MAELVLTNAKIYYAGYDLSGDFNALAVAVGCDALENTKFGATTHTNIGGLKTGAIEARGFWNGGANNDKQIFDRVGTANVPILTADDGADVSEVCYFMQALTAQYETLGQVGEIMPFSISAMATGGTPIVRGNVLYNSTATATANGTAYELGAVSATKKLYAGLWVIGDPAGTSPTLDVKIQSDDGSGMGSPTDRITFTQATTRTAQFATPVSGAITDTFWRVAITVGGTDSPSFRFAVAMGIL